MAERRKSSDGLWLHVISLLFFSLRFYIISVQSFQSLIRLIGTNTSDQVAWPVENIACHPVIRSSTVI